MRSAQHYLSRYVAWVSDGDCAIALRKLQGELDDFARREFRRVRVEPKLSSSKGYVLCGRRGGGVLLTIIGQRAGGRGHST